MTTQEYIEKYFLGKSGKIRYSRIKGEYLKEYHLEFYNKMMLKTNYLKTENITERIYHLFHSLNENIICKNKECNNISKFINFKDGYTGTCSVRCSTKESAERVHQTKLKNNSYNEIVKLQKKTMLERYGYNNALKVPEIKKQVKQTTIKKYGGQGLQSSYIFNKARETNLEQYGVENPFQAEEVKQTIKNTCNEKYGVDNWMHLGLWNGYKWKNYVMPSGKTVKIQGYENKALDELLTIYKEDEIVIEKSKIPKISYIKDDNKHYYFPDIYIPKENLIIEVKSEWVMLQNFYINMLKFQAVKSAGYKFTLKVF